MGLFPNTTENHVAWSSFISNVREFFVQKGYLEVTTPILVEAGAFESSIDPLQVFWKGGKGELHTSPEIAMKELLAEIKTPIFQICKCFRDDFESPHHAREFTMLEFYEPGADYTRMKALVRELVTALSRSDLSFREYKAATLFSEKVGMAPEELKGTEPWEDQFFRHWLEKVEPAFNTETPTIVTDYPLAISPLSTQIKETNYAERFELYWKGMEVCNGCTELSDPSELKRRHQQESKKREKQGKPPHPFSERLSKATGRIGKAAGVAVGLDRLFICVQS